MGLPFINGTELHATLPAYRGSRMYWVVTAKRIDPGVRHQWVTAEMDSLAAESWTAGSYFHTEAAAVADLLVRAGTWHLTYAQYNNIAMRDDGKMSPESAGVIGARPIKL